MLGRSSMRWKCEIRHEFASKKQSILAQKRFETLLTNNNQRRLYCGALLRRIAL